MEIMQFLTIMVTMVGGFAFIYKEFKHDIQQQSTELREDIKTQVARTDQLYAMFQENLSIQSARSDQLYTMFIDLLKNKVK